jgi:hypothetical protein
LLDQLYPQDPPQADVNLKNDRAKQRVKRQLSETSFHREKAMSPQQSVSLKQNRMMLKMEKTNQSRPTLRRQYHRPYPKTMRLGPPHLDVCLPRLHPYIHSVPSGAPLNQQDKLKSSK